MKKLKRFLGKRKDELLGCNITAGSGARGMRPGRSGAFFFCHTASKSFVHATETAFPLAAPRGRRNSVRPMTVLRNGRSSFVKSLGRFIGCLSPCFSCFPTAPKRFGRAVPLQIGGLPRRWTMPSGMSPQTGRSMVEMLAVLAIIGVLSVAALAGLTYAMNKHRANTIYNDVHLLALHVMDTGKDTVPADFYPDSGKTFTLDTTTYADGFVVKVAAVSEKVCDRIMEVNDPSIEKIYVGSEETTNCSGAQDMGFMFLYDGTFTSGGTSGGLGSGTDPVDPCEGIVCQHDGMCIDGICRCVDGYSGDYCEVEPDLCINIVLTECQETCDVTTGLITNKPDGVTCTTTDGHPGTCQSGVCEVSVACTDGIDIIGKNGHIFCRSKDLMSHSQAAEWCTAQGRTLSSMSKLCKTETGGWDGQTGPLRCPNVRLEEKLGEGCWTSTTGTNKFSGVKYAYYISLGTSDGYDYILSTEELNSNYYAICY